MKYLAEAEDVVTRGRKCVYICTGSSKISQDPTALSLVDSAVSQANQAGLVLSQPPTVVLRNGKECWGVCVNWPPKRPTGLKINWPRFGSSVRHKKQTQLAQPAPAPRRAFFSRRVRKPAAFTFRSR